MYELDFNSMTSTTSNNSNNNNNDKKMGANLKMKIKRKLNDSKLNSESTAACTSSSSTINNSKRIRRNSCGSTDSNYSIESSSISETIVEPASTLVNGNNEQKVDDLLLNKTTFKESSTSIDQELLGPCKSGSPIQLEGIVWTETNQGVLVLNVTWKGKTFIGALMDTTNQNWAPPMFTNKLNESKSLAYSTSLSTTSSACTLDEEEQFLLNQDPSIRILRNGKRRYLNLANKLSNIDNKVKKSTNNNNKDKNNNLSFESTSSSGGNNKKTNHHRQEC